MIERRGVSVLCALLISNDETTISHFQSIALDFGCVLKVAESEEEYYEFPADTPFTAVFLDSKTVNFDALKNISDRFVKAETYLFVNEKTNNEFVYNNIEKCIIGLDNVKNIFVKLFPHYFQCHTVCMGLKRKSELFLYLLHHLCL